MVPRRLSLAHWPSALFGEAGEGGYRIKKPFMGAPSFLQVPRQGENKGCCVLAVVTSSLGTSPGVCTPNSRHCRCYQS